MSKKDLLKKEVEHIDITAFDSTPIIKSYENMSLSARDIARAARLLEDMIRDDNCTIILTIAGSTSAAGCMKIYSDMVKYNMVDAVVATGATIADMDFFEALGFRHYQGNPQLSDKKLKEFGIDRIYDTLIDEAHLRICDNIFCEIADGLAPRPYTSREFIWEMGRYLTKHAKKTGSLVQTAYKKNVPIFCPASSDSSAGFGLAMHQFKRIRREEPYITLDSAGDFRELTQIKMGAGTTGLFMIGGGVPKNFAQDTVVCAELLGKEVQMHEYAVQITVADARDGACSSSTLSEAESWGKVSSSNGKSQMVYAEATSVLPLIASYIYHSKSWKPRKPQNLSKIFMCL